MHIHSIDQPDQGNLISLPNYWDLISLAISTPGLPVQSLAWRGYLSPLNGGGLATGSQQNLAYNIFDMGTNGLMWGLYEKIKKRRGNGGNYVLKSE